MHACMHLAAPEDEASEPTPSHTHAALLHTQASTNQTLRVPQRQHSTQSLPRMQAHLSSPANDADVVLFLVGGAQVAGRAGPAVVHDG